ncbi:MAG: DinB family protein [Ardenticatenaceae bacterium]
MIESIESFISYFGGVRRRTKRYIKAIPAEQVEWAPSENEFSCGDIVRHITSGERMFVGVVVEGRWRYGGHERTAENSSLSELMAQLDATHAEAMDALRTLSDEQLLQKRPMLKGPPAKAWRILMAMIEHEIHHRSQLANHLTLMGVEPPQIYGLGVEDVIALAVG